MADDATVRERVQELTWALVDDQLTDDEVNLLDSLLLSDEGARKHYLDCVHLHTDLMMHFAENEAVATAAAAATKSPVLGFLNAGNPPLGLEIPRADAAQ